MTESQEWEFDFVLSANDDERRVSEKEATALMDSIIDFVESRGLCIGGGFRPTVAEESN